MLQLTYDWQKSIETEHLERLKSLLLQISKNYLQSGFFLSEDEIIYLVCSKRILSNSNNPHIAEFYIGEKSEFIGICSNINEYETLVSFIKYHYENSVKVGKFNFFPNIPIFILDFETNNFQIWYNFQQIFKHTK